MSWTISGPAQILIKNLRIAYDSCPVLEDVSVDIAPNKITAIIGPSGCGKSSFLKAINRIGEMSPGFSATGSITIGDQNLYDGESIDLIELRKQVGMIFQKPTPFPVSIRKNIQLALREHGCRKRGELESRTETALRDVGLWDEVSDRLDHSAAKLSGGQQQRLCIARAMALNPKVLLFDEPCSALDPVSSRTVENLILRLKDRMTVVIVTHNLAQAQRIADNVVMFWFSKGKGQMIETGCAASIFESPTNPVTKAYLQGKEG